MGSLRSLSAPPVDVLLYTLVQVCALQLLFDSLVYIYIYIKKKHGFSASTRKQALFDEVAVMLLVVLS